VIFCPMEAVTNNEKNRASVFFSIYKEKRKSDTSPQK